MVANPKILFLDEPTTGLDPQARRAIWDVIRNLRGEGRSVLLTTHYLEEAEELADRVAIMNHGKIIAMGTPAEIIAKHGSGESLTVRAERRLADYINENSHLKAEYDPKGVVSIRLERKNDVIIALGMIQESGIHWDTLSTKRDSLEDIFVRMVGEGISEKGELAKAR